jgi:acetolactate synthase-1/3 small subunit
MKHIISALVENKAGVLAHIAGLFSARSFNIESLTVGATEDPSVSRMTIVVGGDEAILEQIRKQLGKIIDVLKVVDMSGKRHVERDLALIKVNAPPAKRPEIVSLVEVFRGRVVDISTRDLVIEVSGPEEKVEACIDLLRPYGIREMCRTGVVAMLRGEPDARSNGK